MKKIHNQMGRSQRGRLTIVGAPRRGRRLSTVDQIVSGPSVSERGRRQPRIVGPEAEVEVTQVQLGARSVICRS